MSDSESDQKPVAKRARGRKTTTVKSAKKTPSSEQEMFPRTESLKIFVGAHVSAAKGVFNALTNSNRIGGNALALFVKPQRKWVAPPLKPEEISNFAKIASELKYDLKKHALPHGSYLINIANLDPEKNKQAYGAFLEELKRCEQLGIGNYNFHPGSTLGNDRTEALAQLALNINRAIKETSFIKIVIENMAGHGNLIGSTFNDLREVIDLIEDKSRVGICIDTCHTFAAGIDIRTQESYDKMWADFDNIVGLKYLSAIHLNDSKAPLGSNRDLHQNIGVGFLGLESFRVLMNSKHVEDLPMILETPTGEDDTVWAREIKLLEWLIGKAKDDPEFIKKRDELSQEGAADRKVHEEKNNKKQDKKQGKLNFKRKKSKDSDADSD
ncbi:xylose isomerase-like protein [Kockiozyma suomiensis]|uniref:xylose isomerase-like protein n=1 Tax=Kockiozyma suomiensis TaxID=1337062 RepID=UPI003343C922